MAGGANWGGDNQEDGKEFLGEVGNVGHSGAWKRLMLLY